MRLIDADDLKKTWYREHNIEPGQTGAMFVGYNEVPRFIDRMRTVKPRELVDAVPVVRCKDCKEHFFDKPNDCFMCHRHEYGEVWQEDDYCSHGERREE